MGQPLILGELNGRYCTPGGITSQVSDVLSLSNWLIIPMAFVQPFLFVGGPKVCYVRIAVDCIAIPGCQVATQRMLALPSTLWRATINSERTVPCNAKPRVIIIIL